MNVYLEYNLLDSIRTNSIRLPVSNEIQWVYSDEHFNEIDRGDDANAERLLPILQHLRARKLKSPMGANFHFLDNTELLEYQDPADMFAAYLHTLDLHPNGNDLFNPLIAFFNGNTDALDPVSYAEDFFRTVDGLLSDVDDSINDAGVTELRTSLKHATELMAASFGQLLQSARSSIKPIAEARKLLTKRQLSDLNPDNGGIVDQIWDILSPVLTEITKDQFFGRFPFESNNTVDTRQPTFLGILHCHSVLNYLGYWPDRRISRLSNIPSTRSDAVHIAYGAFCQAILSGDTRLCRKAAAIYSYFGVGTQVMHIDSE